MTFAEQIKLHQAVRAVLIDKGLWYDFLLDVMQFAKECPESIRTCGRLDVALYIQEMAMRTPTPEDE